jgi:hypothetical protein
MRRHLKVPVSVQSPPEARRAAPISERLMGWNPPVLYWGEALGVLDAGVGFGW